DKKAYLDIIHTYMEVHGTVHGTSTIYIPGYVKNHGILSGRDLQFLLRETKLFVGLGFPYEGPAPLEAIANGCAFLNLRFNPPKSSKNTEFFKGKPTLRELTSQHPYAEVYIGKPHVWTVDISDLSEVEKAVKSILNQKIDPYLPYEFTCEGMLQRMNAFIERQDFCHGQVMWPPLSALQVKIAEPGKSCKQVCQESQLICEPSFFQHLNKDKALLRHNIECLTMESANDILVPSFDGRRKHCVFQGDLLLFSCAGSHPTHRRICPCRDYIKGQVALCKDCL
ncbi:PREDICTED: alpha-1,6-mannosylglycoprotein 6-beta-N-acetylglucosaminyltransferase A, partial [Fulmarus glacialis]